MYKDQNVSIEYARELLDLDVRIVDVVKQAGCKILN